MRYEAMLAETVCMRGHQGDEIDAYLARPLGAGPYPGVVVIHHMPGWDEASKELTRKFAHHGYAAISPNLHHREGKDSPEENSASVRAAGGMPDDRSLGDIEGATSFLRSLPYCTDKIGAIGFCSGGRQAYLAACKISSLNAAVDCYGGGVAAAPDELTERQPVAPIDFTPDLHCPLLGLFGQEDRRPSPEEPALPIVRAVWPRRPASFARRGGKNRGGSQATCQDVRIPYLRECGPCVLFRRPSPLPARGGG